MNEKNFLWFMRIVHSEVYLKVVGLKWTEVRREYSDLGLQVTCYHL